LRRIILLAMVAALMAVMTTVGALSVSAQTMPGETTYCDPWQQEWHISESGWWYFWWWRWCYKPGLQYPWYVEWDGWEWDGPA
jgi:hypothetical protein